MEGILIAKCAKSLFITFTTHTESLRDTDFAHFSQDGSKFEIEKLS